jgi:hypothetical protein
LVTAGLPVDVTGLKHSEAGNIFITIQVDGGLVEKPKGYLYSNVRSYGDERKASTIEVFKVRS